MLNRVFVYLMIISSSFVYSQKHEIGAFFGVPNLIGDIGRSNYIQPNPINLESRKLASSFGINYRFNFNPRHSLRLNVMHHDIFFSDLQSVEDYRYQRFLDKNAIGSPIVDGTNQIYNADLNFEYNFFDINDEHKNAVSPYTFFGLGFMSYYQIIPTYTYSLNSDPLSVIPYQVEEKNNRLRANTLALNFGLGLKVKFNYNWIFFADISFKPTFVDDLDHSSIYYHAPVVSIKDSELSQNPDILFQIQNDSDRRIKSRNTGNLTTNDWIVVTGFGFAYSFGRPPCYCK